MDLTSLARKNFASTFQSSLSQRRCYVRPVRNAGGKNLEEHLSHGEGSEKFRRPVRVTWTMEFASHPPTRRSFQSTCARKLYVREGLQNQRFYLQIYGGFIRDQSLQRLQSVNRLVTSR